MQRGLHPQQRLPAAQHAVIERFAAHSAPPAHPAERARGEHHVHPAAGVGGAVRAEPHRPVTRIEAEDRPLGAAPSREPVHREAAHYHVPARQTRIGHGRQTQLAGDLVE
ncbi:hypothetical protein MMF94_22000 [Pseudonocardia alaniniphila]|uniref:Uncharacterized protein n=1 Tax=Pseudonocardia alaniniphila TaxID=75291 RepID=A0ABS9TIZ6_9PSEU|nr:hypothetical protein [Pseudonocardia alaniniphila]MCH6168373.1 hypothetical protein [Pseudonocardia alaniniphila]